MRIIAGRHRGRRLAAPPGDAVRPTHDRAREALFSILEHGEPPLAGSRFLDLFAGTGAIGLEAVSRGAAAVLLVEQDREALAAAEANRELLGETRRVGILRADATRLGAAPQRFDIVFLDPPYGSGLLGPALAALRRGGWLAPGGRVVCELAGRDRLELDTDLEAEDERRYGKARFVFLRVPA
ncbi:MAG: 16S rRNA (guanine(966)-N(2))-methyltransferase RsmD [Geminicoccaceae bacterium]